jgi:tetratricopeptide (TPR) repeat protein
MRFLVLPVGVAALFVIAGPVLVAAGDADVCAKGTGDEKIAACTRSINSGTWKGPNLAWAYTNRGIAYRAKGEPDRAIADYDKAIWLNPKFADAYNGRGSAYDDKGDRDRAIADFDQAILLNPNYADAYNNRGIAYRAKGAPDRAIADYDQAIRLNPNFALAFYKWGRSGWSFYTSCFLRRAPSPSSSIQTVVVLVRYQATCRRRPAHLPAKASQPAGSQPCARVATRSAKRRRAGAEAA